MLRLIATAVIALVANAVGLLVADLVLDDVSLQPLGLVLAVVIFTVTATLFEPLVRQVAARNAPALLGSTALVATLVSLIVTTLISDDLAITGVVTWILATVIVWAAALGARMLLPLVIFKKTLGRDRGQTMPPEMAG